MTYFKFLIYGLIQGFTEFLPISSTAHLKVFSDFLKIDDPGSSVSAILHLGSIFAILYYFRDDIYIYLKEEKITFKKVIVMGSIGCKVTALIRGEADIYISISTPGKSSPKDWDFAAPDAILRAAGGAITNIDGKELLYNTKGYEHKGIIIATNNALIHNDICMEIKNIISED